MAWETDCNHSVQSTRHQSIHFLFLVDAELARAHVDQQEKTATDKSQQALVDLEKDYSHNRQDLEKVVLGKVLVGVPGVELIG